MKHHRFTHSCWLPAVLFGLLLGNGCSSTQHGQDSPDSIADSHKVPPDLHEEQEIRLPPMCNAADTGILHVATWPGGGVRIVLRGSDGDQGEGRNTDGYSLTALDGTEIPLSISPTILDRNYLLVLFSGVTPSSAPPELPDRIAGFLEALPGETSVALYRDCGQLEQIASFTTDRALLSGLTAAGQAWCPEGATAPAAFAGVPDELAAIAGPAFPGVRTMVEVSGGDAPVDLTVHPGDVFKYAVGSAAADLESGLSLAVQSVSQRLTRYISLGACTGLEPGSFIELATPWGDLCPITLPEGPEEESDLPCDAQAIADGKRDYPDRVEFLFTPEERAVFDQRRDDKSDEDYDLHVRLGAAGPVSATAHLRGQTSLDCKRKSFTVNLKSNHGRHILPGSATDEFYLISMCKDDRYFQQYTANLLARQLGLFPMQFGLVELLFDGETQGVYLLLEKTTEALLEDSSRVHTIVRRRFDPDPKMPEVKYPSDTSFDSPLMDSYWALESPPEEATGPALVQEMNLRMNLDLFLSFLAFHTLMGNGDYIDEVFFISTQAVRGENTVDWHHLMAWDMDDLFSACHHNSKHAMDDPFDILFCAEGNIEKAIMTDPAVYARFVDILENMMLHLITKEAVDAALKETESVLLPWFERPDICAAMDVLVKSNPEAIDPEVAQADILDKMNVLRKQYDKNFSALQGKIQAYRLAVEAQ